MCVGCRRWYVRRPLTVPWYKQDVVAIQRNAPNCISLKCCKQTPGMSVINLGQWHCVDKGCVMTNRWISFFNRCSDFLVL